MTIRIESTHGCYGSTPEPAYREAMNFRPPELRLTPETARVWTDRRIGEIHAGQLGELSLTLRESPPDVIESMIRLIAEHAVGDQDLDELPPRRYIGIAPSPSQQNRTAGRRVVTPHVDPRS